MRNVRQGGKGSRLTSEGFIRENDEMRFDEMALAELAVICSHLAARDLTNIELQEIAERIIRFLVNSLGHCESVDLE